MLEVLVSRLRRAFASVRNQSLLNDAAADAILDYCERPSQFDPARSGLLTYLTMSAKGNLLNALAKETRRAKRERPIEDVEIAQKHGNLLQERDELSALEESLDPKLRQMRSLILDACSGPLDRKLMGLILAGERRTSAYAAVLGLQTLPRREQEREVKRHKDRLKKRVLRLREGRRAES